MLYLKKIFKASKEKLFYVKNFFSSLYGICFISFFIAATLISMSSVFLVSKITQSKKNQAYMSAISYAKQKIVSNARLYNAELENMYENIDYELFSNIEKSLEELGDNYLEIDPIKIKQIAKKYGVSVSLVNYETTKAVMSSRSFFKNINLKNDFQNFESEIKLLEYGKPRFRFSHNSIRQEIFLYNTILTRDGKYFWDIKKSFSKKHPIIRFIKKLKFLSLGGDPYVNKIGVYSEDGLTSHGLRKVALPPVLEKKLFERKCSSLEPCVLWKEISTPHGIEGNQYIKYIGMEFDGKSLLVAENMIFNQLDKIILFSLLFSLILSFFVSRWLTGSVYQILNPIKFLRKDFDSGVKIPHVWNTELNELSLTVNGLIEELLQKKEEAQRLAKEILSTKDKERRHISRDLHDSVGQLLVTANLKILEKKNKEAEEIITLASEELRNIYDELEPRSLEKMSLKDALEWYLLKFFPSDFPYHIEVKIAEKLSTEIRIQVYRIIQEAIANIKKHAAKTQALDIEIYEISKKLIIKVKNQFSGERKEKDIYLGRGLKNIQLRAESLGGKLLIKKAEETFELEVSFNVSDRKGE